MAADAAAKVTTEHLRRAAYLYVRQSTLRQVVENTTSTDRQYALRQRAVALGWPAEQVIVIDEDLGRSGASAEGRDGFQRLVADVGMGRAGLVLGLEVSRLARNNADWHRLLEICALTGTLILDEDGLYDPARSTTGWSSGLKGAMSEAELHLLKARLRGGQLTKARRGELVMPLPVGFVYDPAGRVVLDPDLGVQQAVRHLSRHLHAPARPAPPSRPSPTSTCCSRCGCAPAPTAASSAGIGWRITASCRCCTTPATRARFATGADVHGAAPTGRPATCCNPARTGSRSSPGRTPVISAGSSSSKTSAAWPPALRPKARPPCRPAPGRPCPAAGTGGLRPLRAAHDRALPAAGHDLTPIYICQRTGIQTATGTCQAIVGGGVDHAVSELLLATVSPMALEVALAVSDELAARAADADRLRRAQVERARHTAELARVATWPSTPTTAWSPPRWRPTGTKHYATTPARRRTTSAKPPRPRPSMPSNAPRSSPWPATSRPCGTTPPPRSGNESAWCGCCWPTSPSCAARPSPRTCASPAVPPAASPCPLHWPRRTCGAPQRRSSPRSTGSWTITPTPRRPKHSTAPGPPRAPASPSPPGSSATSAAATDSPPARTASKRAA